MRQTEGNADDESSSKPAGRADHAARRRPTQPNHGLSSLALPRQTRTSRSFLSSLVLALTLPVLAVACQPSPPPAVPAENGEPAVIESDDGQARLRVPPGALPEGVSLEDLRITRVSP